MAEANFPVAKKLQRARLRQPGKPTQEEVAELLGIRHRVYQTYELGRVRGPKTLSPVLKALSEKWDIPDVWWYDGRDSDPYEGGFPSTWVQKSVRIYHANAPGRPAYGIESSHMGKINADIARLEPLPMELDDNRMAPRIPAGWTIYGVKGRRVRIGKAYIATHKHRKVTAGAEELPELVAGIYTAEETGFFLAAPGQPPSKENVADLDELHLVVARSWAPRGDQEGAIVEQALTEGLSMAPLPPGVF